MSVPDDAIMDALNESIDGEDSGVAAPDAAANSDEKGDNTDQQANNGSAGASKEASFGHAEASAQKQTAPTSPIAAETSRHTAEEKSVSTPQSSGKKRAEPDSAKTDPEAQPPTKVARHDASQPTERSGEENAKPTGADSAPKNSDPTEPATGNSVRDEAEGGREGRDSEADSKLNSGKEKKQNDGDADGGGKPLDADAGNANDKVRATEANTSEPTGTDRPGKHTSRETDEGVSAAGSERGRVEAAIGRGGNDETGDDPDDEDSFDLEAMRQHIYEQVAKFGPKQLQRYEQYRRSDLKKEKVKKLLTALNPALAKSSDPFLIAVKGLAKLFVGDIVEAAIDVRKQNGETGALQPKHLREAYRRLRREGIIPTTEARPPAFR